MDNNFLISLMFLLAAVVGVIAMVQFARHDSFAGPGIGHQQRDELGPVAAGRR